MASPMEDIAKKTSSNLCIRNCCLDTQKVCVGCGSSLAEILEWHQADHNRREQITVMAKVRLRQPQSLTANR